MKKLLCILLTSILVLSLFSFTAFAEHTNRIESTSITQLRAGGGGGSNAGSSGGGGSSGSSYHYIPYGRGSWVSALINAVMLPIIFCSSAIAFYFKLSKRSRKSKKLIKQIQSSDNAWKFKNIQKTVEESFYAIQNAWTNLDMTDATKYLSDELLESFNIKLNWMKHRKEKNILKNITLLKTLPVSVYDDSDNSRDHIWFYIKGKMVDYTINTETMTKTDGSKSATSFVEYWQYIRKDDRWVLNKILQKNEEDKIAFTE